MELFHRINWVDILVLIIIFRISYVASKEGLSHEIFPLFGGIFITVLSLHYYGKIGQFFYQNLFRMPIVLANFLSFLLLVVIAGMLFKLIKLLLDKIIKIQWHPFIENFGGLIAGVLRASIVASLVLITLALMPLPYLQRSIRERSLTGPYVLRIGPDIYAKTSRILPTIKIEGASAGREAVIESLLADKSILRARTGEDTKKTQEWEK